MKGTVTGKSKTHCCSSGQQEEEEERNIDPIHKTHKVFLENVDDNCAD
jgi:hypothetical protein